MGQPARVPYRREVGVRRNRRPLFGAGYVLGVILLVLVAAFLVVLIFHG